MLNPSRGPTRRGRNHLWAFAESRIKRLADILMTVFTTKMGPVPMSDFLPGDLRVVIDFQLVAVHSCWNVLQHRRSSTTATTAPQLRSERLAFPPSILAALLQGGQSDWNERTETTAATTAGFKQLSAETCRVRWAFSSAKCEVPAPGTACVAMTQ